MKTSQIKVVLIDHMGTDLSVVNAARVSFDKESKELTGGDVKLLKYLAVNGHTSPFNHAFLSFLVKAPIFVARQLVKHKFLPWNEISRRYVDTEPEFYFPSEWRDKGENVKQGSGEGIITKYVFKEYSSTNHPHQHGIDETAEQVAKAVVGFALEAYKAMLYAGGCPEQARMLLPLNTMTEWYWSGSLGAFLDMLKLRLDPHTQKESRDVAILIAEEVERLFPISYEVRLK